MQPRVVLRFNLPDLGLSTDLNQETQKGSDVLSFDFDFFYKIQFFKIATIFLDQLMQQIKTRDPCKVMMIKGLQGGVLKGLLKGLQDKINSQHFKTSDIEKKNLPSFLKWFPL